MQTCLKETAAYLSRLQDARERQATVRERCDDSSENAKACMQDVIRQAQDRCRS